MTMDRELEEILAEIGRKHRTIGAPVNLESRLSVAADSRRTGMGESMLRLVWVWATVLILLAAAGTAGVIWQTRRGNTPNQQVRSAPIPEVPTAPALSSPRSAARESPHAKFASAHRTGRGRASHRDSSRREESWNSLDEFVALPMSEGLRPAAELSVVRIKLKGSDLRNYGLDTPADAVAQPMLAEFVVGEDGLPRAIRIVQ